MVLLWVIGGLTTAAAIARMNKSNKLFWILFTSFMVGIAGGSLYNKCKDTQCETSSSSSCRTLLTCNTMSNDSPVTIDECMCMSTAVPTIVSHDELGFNDDDRTLGKCYADMHEKPPQLIKLKKVCWNILTHPELQDLLSTLS